MWQRRNWWVQFGIMIATIAGVIVAFLGYISWSQQVEYVGRVLDAETVEPVVNAEVTFSFAGAPPIVYTDSRGVYRFLLEMDGNPLSGQIVVRADEYEPYFLYVTLHANTLSLEDVRLKRLQSNGVPPEPAVSVTVIALESAIAPTIQLTTQPTNTPTSTETPAPPASPPTIQPINTPTIQPIRPSDGGLWGGIFTLFIILFVLFVGIFSMRMRTWKDYAEGMLDDDVAE